MAEIDLYPFVGEFLKNKLGCFYVQDQPTITRYGAIDVVGLRQGAGRYGGNAEVVGVEVKASGSRFLNSAGQAVGYSVMADRCYLAIGGDSIGEVESELAAQLNIGLLVVRPGSGCEIVLTSPQHHPLRAQKLTLIRKLGYVECVVCGSLVKKSQILKLNQGALGEAAREQRGFKYLVSREGPPSHQEVRYVCPDCTRMLSGA